MSGKRRIIIVLTGRQQNSLTLILFSPREPLFRRRVRGSRGVFSRRMSGKRRIFILTKRQHFHFAWLVQMFSPRAPLSFSRNVSSKRKRIISFHFSLLLITFANLARAKKKRVIAYKEFSSIRNSRGWGTVDCPERVETT